jgi:hypothetical protein
MRHDLDVDENGAFAFQEFVDRFTNELQLGKPYFFKNVEFELARLVHPVCTVSI